MIYTREQIEDEAKWVELDGYARAGATIRQLLAENDALREDAARYRMVRSRNWNESEFCVVTHPKANVKLGAFCPSGENLDCWVDEAIDAARK